MRSISLRYACTALLALASVGCDDVAVPAPTPTPTPEPTVDPFASYPTCASAVGPAIVAAPPDDPRRSVVLESAAGFVELPPRAPCFDADRMFYSFRPADEEPATKPLLVLTNGGPGGPTSMHLLVHGTGPKRLDCQETGIPGNPAYCVWVDNPHSLTRFANVLYIDEAQVGFSYGVHTPSTDPACDPESAEDHFVSDVGDAASFVRTTLGFLDRTPELRSAPIVFVGESYGAHRMTLVLDLLLHHAGTRADFDVDLSRAIATHLQEVFPEHVGAFAPEDVARQFGHLISIQGPLIFQGDLIAQCVASRPSGTDPYDAARPEGWTQALEGASFDLWRAEIGSDEILGVALRDLPELGPLSRANAFRIGPLPMPDRTALWAWDEALGSALGALPTGDAYYNAQTSMVGGLSRSDSLSPIAPYVRVFSTHALRDNVVCDNALLNLPHQVVLDAPARDEVARPGRARYLDDHKCVVDIRMPEYQAGHMVPTSQPEEFADDVEAWLSDPSMSAAP